MIRFSLKCEHGHGFDSWFQSAEAFERLAARRMIACAICGTRQVEKALMAPQIRASRTDASPDTRPDMRPTPAEQALAQLRRRIEETADYVGTGFAAEARDIHAGTAPARAIYGEARPQEARRLIEEGVPVAPLPFAPRRKTN